MEQLQAYRAADIGKRPGNKVAPLAIARRLIFAVVTLFAASVFSSASHAQSGPFAGMAGTWSGGGSVTLDDGSSERIRCRATYAVGEGGAGLNQSLTCASDSYKFALSTNVTAQGGSLSGTWSETSRNINGMIQGRGSNGSFQLNNGIPDPPPARDSVHEARVREFLGHWGPTVAPEAGEAATPDFAAQCEAMLEADPRIISSIMGLYPEEFVAKMMAFDANKDGKLTKEELTDTRLHALFDRADTNKDGVVTREELEALFTKESLPSGGDFGGPKGKGDKKGMKKKDAPPPP